jgi:hypothetical protein
VVTHPGVSRVKAPTSPVAASPRGNSPCAVVAGGNHTANYRGCVKWKEAKSALAQQTLQRGRRTAATAHPPAPQQQRAGPTAEQMDLGERWNHVVQGGRVVKAPPAPPTPKKPSQPVTEANERPTVTATSKTARPRKSEPKTPAAPKQATGKPKKMVAPSVAPVAAERKTPSLVAPKPTRTSPLGDITPFLAHLPPDECMELTCRLLTSVASLLRGMARARAILNTVIIFLAEYDSTP